MTVSSKPRSARLARRVRATLLISTAVSFAAAGQAFAQNVTNVGGTADITVNQPSASGTPNAVNLQTNGGVISVDIDTVTSSATSGQWDNAIYLTTTGNKSITGVFDTITVTGAGDIFALYAQTDAGAINLDIGTVNAAGHSTPGVIASSTSGNIVLTGKLINTRGLNLDPNSNSGDGLIANTITGNAKATLTSGQSDSLYGSVVGAIGANATVVSTYAKATGNQGSAVFSRASTGTATTTSGTVETTGLSSGAVGAISTGGAAIVNAGTTTVTGGRITNPNGTFGAYSNAVSASGRTGATITAGTTSATGIAVSANSVLGDVAITTTGNTASTFGNAITATTNYSGNGQTATTGKVSLTTAAGTTTSSATTNLGAIVVNARNDIAVDLGIVTGSNTADNIYLNTVVTGGVGKITGSVDEALNSGAGRAIFANSANGIDLTIGTATSAGGQDIVRAVTANGDVALDLGSVTGSGTLNAVFARATNGSASVTADDIVNTSTVTGASGIWVEARNNVTIVADNVDANGFAVRGLAQINGVGYDGSVSITTTGNITSRSGGAISAGGLAKTFAITIGADSVVTGNAGTVVAAGTRANSGGSGSLVNNGTVIAQGNAEGAIGLTTSGDLSIVSNVVQLNSSFTPGTAFTYGAIGAVTTNGGNLTIDSHSVTVTGALRHGIFANASGVGNVSITSDMASSNADNFATIRAISAAGDITIDSGTVVSAGNGAPGIYATSSGGGDIAIKSVNLSTTGLLMGSNNASEGIYTDTSGAVRIDSGTVAIAGYAASGIVAVGGSGVTVTSDKITAGGNDTIALYAYNATSGDVNIVSNAVTTSGSNASAVGVSNLGTGTTTVTSKSVTSTGAGSSGIRASSVNGTTVTTGNVATNGYGVLASSTAGDTGVNVNGTVASTNAYGVQATGGNVAVTIGIGNSVSGKTFGVIGNGRTGVTLTNAGTISGEAGMNLGNQSGVAVNTITNTGTITGNVGAAIVASGTVNLTNAGTLNKGASTPLAVLLFEGNDSVTLKTGSVVNGVIDGGAGTDTMILSGTGTASVASQTLASSVNFENLNVASGYWTVGAASDGAYNQAAIAAGAALQVNAVNGRTGIGLNSIANNGQLVINSTGTGTVALGGASISGTGSVAFTGAGMVAITGANFTYTGATNINGGPVQLASGNIAGDVVIGTGGIFRLGNGGTTGTIGGNLVNNGSFIFDRSDSYTVAGNFTGEGLLTKNGAGTLTFGGNYGFTGTTTINGGSVKFTGQLAPTTEINLTSGTLDLSGVQGGEQTIGELAGTSSSAVQLGDSDLTIKQSTSTSFAGSIAGTGGIEKSGTGTLNLTGVSTYSGDTDVTGGTLKVNGSISNSKVVLATGGTLGGNGTIGGLGGTGGNLAPGNSIGHLTVVGNIVLNPAFVYQVEVNNVGGADRIDATGTAQLGGATLQVLPEAGRYRGRTTYTILTAAGGVSGTFGTVTSSFAFLTPTVSYGTNVVTLALTRNNAAFASFGANAGQVGVATAIQTLGANNALFEETLLLQDTAVRPAFASLTGEIYGGISTGTIENTSALRRSLTGRAAPADAGIYAWGNSLGNWGDADATSRTDHVHTSQAGLIGGVGYANSGFDVAVGYSGMKSKFRSQGEARGTSRAVTGTAGYAAEGGVWVKLGGSYSWNEFNVARRSSLGAISQGLTSSFDGHSSQVFGEAGFMATSGQIAVGPFIGLSQVSTHSDAVAEAGGSTGLVIAADDRDVTFGLAGVKVKGLPGGEIGGMSVNPNVSVAYRRAWGDTAQVLNGRFTGTTANLGILGPIVAKDAAEVGLGVEARSGRFGFSLGYTGTFARNASNHSAQASVSIGF